MIDVMPEKFTIVAKIGAPYGIKGWFNLFSLSDSPKTLVNYERWYIQKGETWEALAIDEIKPHGDHLIAHVNEINDRNAAQSLTNKKVAVLSDQLPPLDKGYYWADLEGLTVITQKSERLGVVKELMNTGANDILIVMGEKRRLIPFIEGKTILKVDLTKNEIIVNWDPEF